jgi:hypothetical protein
VIHDGENRVAGGHERLLLAAAPGQAPVARAQEDVGAAVGEGDAAQGAPSQGLPLPRPLLRDLPADW